MRIWKLKFENLNLIILFISKSFFQIKYFKNGVNEVISMSVYGTNDYRGYIYDYEATLKYQLVNAGLGDIKIILKNTFVSN